MLLNRPTKWQARPFRISTEASSQSGCSFGDQRMAWIDMTCPEAELLQRWSRHRRHQPQIEIPLIIDRGPQVPSSGTFVRLLAPETLHESCLPAFGSFQEKAHDCSGVTIVDRIPVKPCAV